MSEAREIRCYQYVNRAYDNVAKVLAGDPLGLFQRATNAATERAESLFAKLKVTIAGFEVGKDVRIDITKIDTARHAPAEHVAPAIAIDLRWRAAADAGLFPAMRAELLAYALSSDETQLVLHGFYTPPAGILGAAGDTLVGHRLAEASIHRFLDDVAARLAVDAV